jgi:hypothetical protein
VMSCGVEVRKRNLKVDHQDTQLQVVDAGDGG